MVYTCDTRINFTEKKEGVGFEVLTAANMKMAVFWFVAPCRLV
jgi:hypothetical protein